MAKVCEICGRSPVSGNKVSHSNIKTKTRHLPNLQRVRAFDNGGTRRIKVCTRCLKAGKVVKPPYKKTFPKAPEATPEVAEAK